MEALGPRLGADHLVEEKARMVRRVRKVAPRATRVKMLRLLNNNSSKPNNRHSKVAVHRSVP